MNEVMLFKNNDMKVRTIKYEDGSIGMNAEDTARGYGWIQYKNGKEYIKWERMNGYLKDFGFSPQVGKDDFIPESMFYLLGMKAENKKAQEFQKWICCDVIPNIRKGNYVILTELDKARLDVLNAKNETEKAIAIGHLEEIVYDNGYNDGYSIGYENGRSETEQKLIDELNRRKDGNDVLLNLGQCASMLYSAWIEELNKMNIYKLDSGHINGYLVHKGLLIKEYLPKVYKGEYVYDLEGNLKYEGSPHFRMTEDFKEFVSQPGYSFTGKTNDGRKDKIQYNIYFLQRFVNQHKEEFLKYMSGK